MSCPIPLNDPMTDSNAMTEPISSRERGVKRIGFHCMIDPATKDLITRHAERTSQSAGQVVDELAMRFMEGMQTHFNKWVVMTEGLIECKREFEVGSDEREEFNAKQAEFLERFKNDPYLNAELLDWWRETPKIVDESND